jgi:hypothetical protein
MLNEIDKTLVRLAMYIAALEQKIVELEREKQAKAEPVDGKK